HADRREDAGDTATHISKFQTSDILPLCAEGVRSAGACPVHAAIIGKIEARLCARYDVIAIIGVYPHLTHSIVLRKLTCGLWQWRGENIRAEYSPRRTRIGRFENALAAHGERPVIKVACAGINRVMIVRIDRNRVYGSGADQRIIGHDAPRGQTAATV